MHIIKGHYRNEDGLLEPGRLMLEKVADGWRSAEGLWRLEASKYVICRDSVGVASVGIEIASPDSMTNFLPDEGECERIGMVVSGEA